MSGFRLWIGKIALKLLQKVESPRGDSATEINIASKPVLPVIQTGSKVLLHVGCGSASL